MTVEDGFRGSLFSEVKLEYGLAQFSRQGLALGFEFEPDIISPSHQDCERLLLLCRSYTSVLGIMAGGSEPLDTKHGQ